MIAYKFLQPDGTGVFTGFRWPLPGPGGAPGAWVEAPADPCRSGVHACRPADLPLWAGPVLYEVELGGDVVAQATKVVAPRARLRRRLPAWEDEVRAAFTRRCADRAHALALQEDPPLPDWDAVVEPATAEGPALLGFIAARIAEERGGVAAWHAERRAQAAWLAERLGLDPQPAS